MSGDTVIITGATKGLGRALARSFDAAGYRVIALYSSDEQAADSLRGGLTSGNALVMKHDVSVEDAAVWDRPEIQQANGLILINNAFSSFTPKPFHTIAWDDVQRGLDVGLKGSWLCTKAVLRPMIRAGKGRIVNVLTTALHGAPPKGFAGYVAAKHAVRGLTQSLAVEYADKGLRVFSVSPGFMATAMTAAWDERLVGAIRGDSAPHDPAIVAGRIRSILEDPATPGRGEDHPV